MPNAVVATITSHAPAMKRAWASSRRAAGRPAWYASAGTPPSPQRPAPPPARAGQEARWGLVAARGGQAGVVRLGGHALVAQALGHLLAPRPRARVDHRRPVRRVGQAA